MDLTPYATPTRQPLCWNTPEVFANESLWWDPSNEDLDGMSAAARTEHLAAKQEAKDMAEAVAADKCLDCPLFVECQALEERLYAAGQTVGGVVAGRTEAERRALRTPPGRTIETAPANPQIAAGDRGPRNQINDELVRSMTLAGQTAEQIAHEMGCSARSVNRARKRAGLTRTVLAQPTGPDAEVAAEVAVEAAAANPQTLTPTVAVTEVAGADDAEEARAESSHTILRDLTLTNRATRSARPMTRPMTRLTHDTAFRPFSGGRRVSAFMEAIYDHLAHASAPVDVEDLIDIGMRQVSPAEAAEWFARTATKRGNRPTQMSQEEQIVRGARQKVYNGISAASRAKGARQGTEYLARTQSGYSFLPYPASVWRERMSARQYAA